MLHTIVHCPTKHIDIPEIKATPKFLKLAQKIMTTETLQDLIDELSLYPEKGTIMQGTGGIRKIRWRTGKDNKGKSGGVRVIYYYGKNTIILLITLFKKSNKENLDAEEKNELKKILPELLWGHNNVKSR